MFANELIIIPIVWIVAGLLIDTGLFVLQYRYLSRSYSVDPAASRIGHYRARQRWLGRITLGLRLAAWGLIAIPLVSYSHDSGLISQLTWLAVFAVIDRLGLHIARAVVDVRASGRGWRFFSGRRWCQAGIDGVMVASAATVFGAILIFLPNLWAWLAVAACYGFGRMVVVFVRRRRASSDYSIDALEDRVLRQRLDTLCETTGARVPIGVLVNGPPAHSLGARAEGSGRSSRIVVTHRLVNCLSHEQITAVVAHELGHIRLAHRTKYYGLCAAIATIAGIVGGWAFETILGHPVAALTLIYLGHELFAWPVSIGLNALRRRYEYQADAFAIRQVGASALLDALRDLQAAGPHRAGLHPWYHWFYATHPADDRRLAVIAAA